MKQDWSRSWVSSKQPRKQRKFRYQAPLHVRRRFLAAHLAPALRASTGKRSLPLRKGDEVQVMRGDHGGKKGIVDAVDLGKARVTVESVKRKKADGSEVHIPLQPSNLLITKLHSDDKRRKMGKATRTAAASKTAAKPAPADMPTAAKKAAPAPAPTGGSG
ncbi:MAG: 50S ribosomal protein L24 [Candidatus Aenigmarchaeota archaeon]|nr:50S ribosomal protein L24 [Candidatus Aenigmarchaeota archaeon]